MLDRLQELFCCHSVNFSRYDTRFESRPMIGKLFPSLLVSFSLKLNHITKSQSKGRERISDGKAEQVLRSPAELQFVLEASGWGGHGAAENEQARSVARRPDLRHSHHGDQPNQITGLWYLFLG